ncbi:hypothetical protein NOR53_1967 [gamma proteobacterium NOR5-3]|nr:hypothetical protein NOR53_1967 [gamma proteobacterium NOR5-3]
MKIKAIAAVGVTVMAGDLMLAPVASALEVKETWYFDKASAGPFTSRNNYTADRANGGYTFTNGNGNGATATVSGWFGDENTGLKDASRYLRHWSGLSLDRPKRNYRDDDYD